MAAITYCKVFALLYTGGTVRQSDCGKVAHSVVDICIFSELSSLLSSSVVPCSKLNGCFVSFYTVAFFSSWVALGRFGFFFVFAVKFFVFFLIILLKSAGTVSPPFCSENKT